MERKQFIKNIGLTAMAGTTLISCATENKSTAKVELKKGMIIHSVYFWLKDNLSENEKTDFLNFFEALKKVPGIYSYYTATPASTTARDVVDNSFDHHWLALFESMDDINTYEKHPDHLAAAEKYSKYWVKVEVKDSVL